MSDAEIEKQFSPIHFTIDDFHYSLREFDKAVCEALAVSQKIGVRFSQAYKGWSTHVFLRMCIHSQIMIANVPKSRWGGNNYDFWDFSLVAPHTRALLEAELLFMYISEEPICEDEWSAKLNIMHMNDCVKRIELFEEVENTVEKNFYLEQQKIITERLTINPVFKSLDKGTQKRCLSGKALMIATRDELLEKMGKDKNKFKTLFDFLSHYTHILPMSFYRSEPNGRGTGCRNDADFGYIIIAMLICTELMITCTDRMVLLFPDVAGCRKGLQSKFTFGPKPRK